MKKVLYVIIGIAILYLVLCLMGPSQLTIERNVSVNAGANAVNAAIVDHKIFHEKWSPWTEKDPAMKVTYEGEAGQVGHKMSWVSEVKDVGKGSMKIESVSADSVIETLSFEGMGDSKVYFKVKTDNSTTNVIWGMSNKIGFFGRGFMLFMNVDKMVGPDFEKGLSKLKSYVESIPAEPKAFAYEVKEIQWEERTYCGKKETFGTDKLYPFFAENFPKIFADLTKAKLKPSGSPSAIYFKWDTEKNETECAAVACLPKGTVLKGWEKWVIPSSKVLHIEYYGAYNKSMGAHNTMMNYMKEKGFEQSMVIEEYVTDPSTEKDTAKWLSNIFYVLK